HQPAAAGHRGRGGGPLVADATEQAGGDLLPPAAVLRHPDPGVDVAGAVVVADGDEAVLAAGAGVGLLVALGGERPLGRDPALALDPGGDQHVGAAVGPAGTDRHDRAAGADADVVVGLVARPAVRRLLADVAAPVGRDDDDRVGVAGVVRRPDGHEALLEGGDSVERLRPVAAGRGRRLGRGLELERGDHPGLLGGGVVEELQVGLVDAGVLDADAGPVLPVLRDPDEAVGPRVGDGVPLVGHAEVLDAHRGVAAGEGHDVADVTGGQVL